MNRYFPTEHMLVIAVVLMLSARIAAQPSAVLLLQYPLVDHPVYSYLERMQTNGSISLLSSTRPYLGTCSSFGFFRRKRSFDARRPALHVRGYGRRADPWV